MPSNSVFPLHNKKPNLHQMDNLPHDVLLHILSRLPISSFIQFHCVCRSWRLLAQHTQDFDHENENFRCLIFHCDFPIRNQLYFVDFPAFTQHKYSVKRIFTPFAATMPEYDVVGSCNGFLCLSDSLYNDKLFVYNPFTRDYLELPKTKEFSNPDVVCGIGFHPQTKHLKVVKIVYSRFRRIQRRFHHSEVQVFTLGSCNWRSIGRISHHVAQGQSPAVVKGRLHWVSLPRRHHLGRTIVSFDLASEEFIDIPKPDFGSLSRCNFHLVILNDCLSAAVYCSHGKMEIWVMKQYGVKESWVKSFNIGSYMPKALKQEATEMSFKVSKIVLRGRIVRVVCILKSGEILLEYRNRALVLFDPNSGKFKDVSFEGMPNWFQTVVHLGSLNRIDALFSGYTDLICQYNWFVS